MSVQQEMVKGAGDTAAHCHRVREAPSENGCYEDVCADCHVTPATQQAMVALLIKQDLDTETDNSWIYGFKLSFLVCLVSGQCMRKQNFSV